MENMKKNYMKKSENKKKDWNKNNLSNQNCIYL